LADGARFKEAYALGREGAARFGVSLPRAFVPPAFAADLARVKLMTRGRVQQLIELPVMQDARLLLGARLATAALKSAFQIRPELCVAGSTRIVLLCLAHGNFPECPVAYLPIGPIFQGAILGSPRAAREWGQLCLDLLDRFDVAEQRAEVPFVYSYFAHGWTNPLQSAEAFYARAYQAGIETGDVFHASCACSGLLQTMLMRGAKLPDIEREAGRYLDYLERVENEENRGTVLSVRQAARNLMGQTANAASFETADFDESQYVASLANYSSQHFAHFYYVNKLGVLVAHGALDEALQLHERARPLLKASQGMQHQAEHRFHAGRLFAALLASNAPGPRFRWGLALQREVRRFRSWSAANPASFAHKYHLLAAEYAAHRGRDKLAAQHFELAIELASKHGFLQNEAFANRSAARFYHARGQPRVAGQFLAEAAHLFDAWGATPLAEGARAQRVRLGLVAAVRDRSLTPAPPKGSEWLDMRTVTKAALAVSSEIQLSALLPKLLTIALENAGADFGAVLLSSGGDFSVRATALAGGASAQPPAIPFAHDERIVAPLVRAAVAARAPIIVDDALVDARSANDPRVQREHLRSILCIPLLDRGEIRAILYLENRLLTGAFTPARIELLTVLSAQFALSIENAHSYGALEQKVRERTQQLEARNRLIRQIFGRYVSEDIVENLLEAPAGLSLGGERREVSIVMTDIRGFSSLAERLNPEEVIALLNNYFTVMTDVILQYGGTIDEFIGDAILILFGAPIAVDDHAARAVACAIAMQRALFRANELNAAAGLPLVEMGIGINTGEVVVGNIGSVKRAKYGVVGSNVNLASRIESFTTAGQVLASERTWSLIADQAELRSTMQVQPKGSPEPIRIYDVVAFGRGDAELRLPEVADALVPLSEPRPLSFALVHGKEVSSQRFGGRLRAVSPTLALIESDTPAERLSNLDLRFASKAAPHGPLFAKVVECDGASMRVRFTSVPPDARQHLMPPTANAVANQDAAETSVG
jgi:class 3 adenylate cyclase